MAGKQNSAGGGGYEDISMGKGCGLVNGYGGGVLGLQQEFHG
jgi:hypothetical protein